MKVIFLDIDGVLNSTKTCVANGGYPFELTEKEAFDLHALKLLQRFCDSSGVQVVISSAWRLSNTVEDFKQHLELPVIDKTPTLWGLPRGSEIKYWLEENEHLCITHYCIIDADPDMLEEQTEFFVQTKADDGFCWKDYLMMCNILEEMPMQGQARNRNWRTDKSPDEESWMQ